MIAKINAEHFLHIVERGQTVHQDTFVKLWLDKFFGFIVFIENISYDLFEDIFHRHQSGCLSVLVYNDRNMDLLALHRLKQRIDAAMQSTCVS